MADGCLIPLRTVPRRLLQKARLEEGPLDAETARLMRRLDEERPRHRSECRAQARPCPFVSCRHHLFLDVNPDNGSVRFNFPGLALHELPATCALDLAEQGGLTLEAIGGLLNLTRERVRQLERDGLTKLRRGLEGPLKEPARLVRLRRRSPAGS